MRLATLAALGLALGLGGAGLANAAPISMSLYSNFTDTGTDVTVSGTPFETASIGAIDFQSHGGSGGTTSSSLWPTANNLFGAIFTATITTSGLAQTFNLSSDDASYLYIDGKLVGDLPGTHPQEGLIITTALASGTHSLRLAYDNSECCDAVVSLGLTSGASYTSTVPLPATLPTFGVALLALGAVGYGMKRKSEASA